MSAAVEEVSEATLRRRERWRLKWWRKSHPFASAPPPRSRPWRAWTEADDNALRWQWGIGWESRPFSIEHLATVLGRTPEAVQFRAHYLGLRATHEGTLTLAELAEKSGYHPQTIHRVAEHLGLKLETCVATTPHRRQRPGRYAIEHETADAILGWLREQGQVDPFRPRGQGWGELGKPEACLCCGGTHSRHAARGLCRGCYQRLRRYGEVENYPVQGEAA